MIAFTFVTLVFLSTQVAAGGEGWLTNYEEATKLAAETNRPILADFTGSDWCIWCKRLDAEVFRTRQFKKWASENVVLLELDYPSNKPQSAELKKQNKALKNKYKIRGFPTILLLNAKGEVLGKTGYGKGGPAPWIANVKKMIQANAKANTVTLARTLSIAGKLAKAKNKPLLIAAPSKIGSERFDKEFVNNRELAQLADARLIVARVSETETSQFANLRKNYKADANAAFLLIDMRKGELLLAAPADTLAKALIEQIEKALPKLSYGGGWLVDYDKAQAISLSHNKPMLMNFTGSDWCFYCKKIKAEVFNKKEFKAWAKENVILVEVDFPRKKHQSVALKAKNKRLSQKYNVQGFPTILMVQPNGKVSGKMVGYGGGGPKAFIKTMTSKK